MGAVLTIAVTTLGILEGNICVAAGTYEREARELSVGWGWRIWALLKRVWSYSVNILSFMVSGTTTDDL